MLGRTDDFGLDLVFRVLWIMLFIAPIRSGYSALDTILKEKECKTWDSILVSRLSARELVDGAASFGWGVSLAELWSVYFVAELIFLPLAYINSLSLSAVANKIGYSCLVMLGCTLVTVVLAYLGVAVAVRCSRIVEAKRAFLGIMGLVGYVGLNVLNVWQPFVFNALDDVYPSLFGIGAFIWCMFSMFFIFRWLALKKVSHTDNTIGFIPG